MEDTPPITSEDIRGMLLMAPIWDGILWDSLQEGDYAAAEDRFAALLKGELEPSEWGNVYWEGIFSGIPSFRGEIDILTWSSSALPALARAILKTATPHNLEVIYTALPLERARSVFTVFINSLPGKDLMEKKNWLETQNPSLFRYFYSNLAGFSLESTSEGLLSRQGFSRAQIVPDSLRRLLFSSEISSLILDLGAEHKLTEDQIHSLGLVGGSIILGLVKLTEIESTIKGKLRLPDQACQAIAKVLEEKILNPVRKEVVDSLPPEPATGQAETSPSFKFQFSGSPPTPAQTTNTATPETSSPITPTKTPEIPQPLTQQSSSQPFFRRWSLKDETKPEEEKLAASLATPAPVIIQEEMKAQSLSAAPKLGFRISDNKLTEAKDKPAPLRAAKLTISGAETRTSEKEETAPQSVAQPISPLGAKLSIRSSLLGQQPDGERVGLVQKIRETFSKKPEVDENQPPAVPPPPQSKEDIRGPVEAATSPVATDIPTPVKVPILNVSPSPESRKDTAPEILSKKEKLPVSEKPTSEPASQPPPKPLPATTEKLPEKTTEAPAPLPSAKLDLSKIPETLSKEIPPPNEKTKTGVFSWLYKKPSTEPATLIPKPKTQEPETPAEVLPLLSTPRPPTPPPPPRTADLLRSIDSAAAPPPVKKISSLSNQGSPDRLAKPTLPKTVSEKTVNLDIVSTAPKVINYSEYPAKESGS